MNYQAGISRSAQRVKSVWLNTFSKGIKLKDWTSIVLSFDLRSKFDFEFDNIFDITFFAALMIVFLFKLRTTHSLASNPIALILKVCEPDFS
jgi:hypothetical protein